MWFGTEDGLNKYDGYKFTQYKHNPNTKSSITDSYIQDLLEDKKGDLWIATTSGLDKFDRESNSFIHFDRGNRHYNINEIFQDSKGRMWLGTNQGLYLFNPDTGIFTAFKLDSKNKDNRRNSFISQILEDDDGMLWLGTEYGLYRFDTGTG